MDSPLQDILEAVSCLNSCERKGFGWWTWLSEKAMVTGTHSVLPRRIPTVTDPFEGAQLLMIRTEPGRAGFRQGVIVFTSLAGALQGLVPPARAQGVGG